MFTFTTMLLRYILLIHRLFATVIDYDCSELDSISNSIFSSNLCGNLILPIDGESYLIAKDQYASSSFSSRTKPSMIIEAVCDEDIKLAILYAKECDHIITIRSGGHQYSGLSSCNDDEHLCIQLNMKHYNHIDIEHENNINLGPGVNLGDMYNVLDEYEYNLPGGECAFVNLGGHVQTGGYGHALRSLGTLLDYILSFDIILSNGQNYHITKPPKTTNKIEAIEQYTNNFNDDLYWSVLGGNPGSWGVITNYQFYANKNEDTSTSIVTECIWEYNEYVLRELLFNYIDIHDDSNYLSNPNIGIWWTLAKQQPFDTNIMKIECSWSGLNNEPYDSTICDKLFNSAKVIAYSQCIVHDISLSKAHATIWKLDEEREFPLPFVKSIRVSDINLQYAFVEQYVTHLNQIFNDTTNGLFMISQLVSGGGIGSKLYQNDPNNEFTSLSHRDGLMVLTTDLFYSTDINPNSYCEALEWRRNSWNQWLDTKTFNNGTDLRQTWATFDDVNISHVWGNYYDQKQYLRLQNIKQKVDPINLFQTQFTIPIS